MKAQSESQPKKGSQQKTPNTQKSWDSISKERFLKYCKSLNRKPTKSEAELYLYGEFGSIEETEEPIPDWYFELPEE